MPLRYMAVIQEAVTGNKKAAISSSVNKYGWTGVGKDTFPWGITYADVYPKPMRYLENSLSTATMLYRFPGVFAYLFKNAFTVSLPGIFSPEEWFVEKSRYLCR